MSEVLTSRDGAVLEIRLNRPDRQNALTTAMYRALTAALTDAAGDPGVRAVRISGEGRSFCSGNDMKDFLEHPPTGGDSPVFAFLQALVGFEKPIVLAVHGHAVGIGTTMLLHGDAVFLAEDAKLKLPFVDLGLVPEAASSLVLPRIVGHAAAARWLLLGEGFSGSEAAAQGIGRAVPASELDAASQAAARALAAKAPAAVRAAKALMRRWDAAQVQAALAAEADVFRERLASPEFREAAAAFFEKRPPDFSRFG